MTICNTPRGNLNQILIVIARELATVSISNELELIKETDLFHLKALTVKLLQTP